MPENSLRDRIRFALNVFRNDIVFPSSYAELGNSYSGRPDRRVLSGSRENTILNSIITRISVDCAAIEIRHVVVDEYGKYSGPTHSLLDYVLSESSNLDQTARSFRQAIYTTILDDGCAAIVPTTYEDRKIPIDSESNFYVTGIDPESMRVGTINSWYPEHVNVKLYDEGCGIVKDVTVSKYTTSIVENPFYSTMNSKNSTLNRVAKKLKLLDYIDNETASGKLNLLIQLPYTVRNELKQKQADMRLKAIEDQIANSPYGIAYIDGTEKVVQLNRSLENNLLSQVKYLTDLALAEVGMDQSILNGTADENTLNNYFNNIIEPLVSAVTDEFRRKYIPRQARALGEDIRYFRDPFKLVSPTKFAELTETLSRNAILTSNEVREKIGYMPSDDSEADELRNKNIAKSKEEIKAEQDESYDTESDD